MGVVGVVGGVPSPTFKTRPRSYIQKRVGEGIVNGRGGYYIFMGLGISVPPTTPYSPDILYRISV